jgi:hypothetical protein
MSAGFAGASARKHGELCSTNSSDFIIEFVSRQNQNTYASRGSFGRAAIACVTSDSRHRRARPIRTGFIGQVPLLSLFRIVFVEILSAFDSSMMSTNRSCIVPLHRS